ncbi:hypothetical protein P7228_02155 [Altererythrobacter arenosus]|uniref:Uncharacterized protein n=1 Tax=Altererythrobacter arenosus TaxID=3032592 RepID=A0ABY8FSB7_9SPHN|nr:hypothetical protein [Altererythrobacter sp. CAU 1644]WFL77895.1 hypothetical protein P7228_02155 [Altererythrobacter sp. CAU 1644]
MNDLTHDSFRAACDQLSNKVDAENFERFRWTRDEAPKLAKLVQMIKDSVEDRTDIEINEEGGEQNIKRFVIKVHGKRIVGLNAALDQGQVAMIVGNIERSEFKATPGDPIIADWTDVDEHWVTDTIGQLMQRITR